MRLIITDGADWWHTALNSVSNLEQPVWIRLFTNLLFNWRAEIASSKLAYAQVESAHNTQQIPCMKGSDNKDWAAFFFFAYSPLNSPHQLPLWLRYEIENKL